MTTETARAKAINRLTYFGPNGWTARTITEYTNALNDLTPDLIDRAITEAIRTRATRPMANQLREIANALNEQDERRRPRNTTRARDGAGCPDCRQTQDLGTWTGDGTMIICTKHGWAWPGTGHTPDQQDDEPEISVAQWRANALNGQYGHELQRLAERGVAKHVAHLDLVRRHPDPDQPTGA